MPKKSDFTLTKAKDISHDLEAKYGVIASPEEVRAFGLGLTLKGRYQHSKRYVIQQYLKTLHDDIIRPELNIYKKYMSTQSKLKKDTIPSFMRGV